MESPLRVPQSCPQEASRMSNPLMPCRLQKLRRVDLYPEVKSAHPVAKLRLIIEHVGSGGGSSGR